MTSATIVWNLLYLAIIGLTLWLGAASLTAALRLAFRPLLYQAILDLLMAIPFIAALFTQQWIPTLSVFVFVPLLISMVFGLRDKIQAFLQTQGLTFWDLLRFKHV